MFTELLGLYVNALWTYATFSGLFLFLPDTLPLSYIVKVDTETSAKLIV
jgi:hypothetical protein